jgi:hypothetical protein
VSGFGLLFEMAHKKHKIFKKSHTPDAHLPMDARSQERERERERERGPENSTTCGTTGRVPDRT